MTRHQSLLCTLVAAIIGFLTLVSPGRSLAAGAMDSMLTLDALSFIAYHGGETHLVPSGSTLTLRFPEASSATSLGFKISPEDLNIRPVHVPAIGRYLIYRLAGPTSGVMTNTNEGRTITFSAEIVVSFEGDTDTSEKIYPMQFTTEIAAARDANGENRVEVNGLRAVDGVWYTQIVGATTNAKNAVLAPGEAVYTVLSGQFNQLPEME